jgi:hypothetical protein
MDDRDYWWLARVIVFTTTFAAILYLLSDSANAANSFASGPHGPDSDLASMQ